MFKRKIFSVRLCVTLWCPPKNGIIMNITIRPTRLEELGQVMPFYERARRFMAANGNANQWINVYPSPDDIRQDIENGSSYVFVNENQELEGCFAFIRGEDPNYKVIKDGAWLNDRIASGGRVKGLMDLCLEWCSSHCPNLRVDTHRDNKVLQNILLKNGFTYCGIIYVKNGTERLAYQRTAVTR